MLTRETPCSRSTASFSPVSVAGDTSMDVGFVAPSSERTTPSARDSSGASKKEGVPPPTAT